MTLPYSQLTAITDAVTLKIANNVFNSTPMLSWFKKFEKPQDSGERIKAPIISADDDNSSTGNFYTGSETLTQEEVEDITAAYFQWKQIHESIVISGIDIAKNQGKAGQVKLVATKAMIAERRLRTKLTKGILSDGSAATGMLTTAQITGLEALFNQTSGTSYGGVKEDDLASWVAHYDGGSSADRQLSLSILNALQGGAYKDGKKPNATFLSQATHNEFADLLGPHQRITSELMKGLGHTGVLEYNGMPFIIEDYMTDGDIYMLNSEFVFLAPHKNMNMKAVLDIPSRENSDSMLKRIQWYGNLICSSRRNHAKADYVKTA